jgi:DNA polymerase-3 subunit delta'
MVVGPDGKLPLPWLDRLLDDALSEQRGHALLVHGAAGSGSLSFGLCLAQAWLCEAAERSGDPDPAGRPGASAGRPCGRCASCRLVQSRSHPDLLVLLPEVLRRDVEWPLSGDKADADDSKRKPSKQIRIDEVRLLIDWATRTPSRGRGKVALIHPADSVNHQAANALLKTLEEPPASTRLVLTCGDPELLLPTVRSRCQRLRLAEPPAPVALAWLAAQGVLPDDAAGVLLRACSGRPLDAYTWSKAGVDAATWAALPQGIAQGQTAALAGWPVPRVVDALQKLCHDALLKAGGAPSRYFPNECVPSHGQTPALADWSRELQRVARHDGHPWNEGLLVDALVQAGARALARGPAIAPTSAHTLGPVLKRRLDTLG